MSLSMRCFSHVPPSLSQSTGGYVVRRGAAAAAGAAGVVSFRSAFTQPNASRHAALHVCRRHVHERPYQELPEDLSRGEAYAVARDALLQLNVMHRRGIEPDALMYTSLIATMGRAGLEWQAYKLFSRMIEQNIQPLPETYVALRDATSKQRASLREQIQTKIEETVNVFPEELAATELERQREEDRRCIAKFNEYMRGVLPATTDSSLDSTSVETITEKRDTQRSPSDADGEQGSRGSEGAARSTGDEAPSSSSQSVATMHIRNPADAWNAAEMAKEHRSHAQGLAKGDAAAELRAALERLDDEELRIYLAAQRQLRHGTKAQLIERVLKTVSGNAIRAMLDRRAHYFRSVEQLLAADLRQLNMAGSVSATSSESKEELTKGAATPHAEKDRTLAAEEQEAVSPDVLHAPWGILRKPMRRRREAPAPRNAERLERVRLSAPELLLVRQKAETNDLDELPESMLRRYAYQFQLRWRRSEGAASLLEAVRWHVTTYFASALQHASGGGNAAELTEGSAAPTPAIRLQREEEGMRQTLENFEAFRVIAQRTHNLQVVDSREINRHLQHVRQDTIRRERKVENALRRERHVMAAAGLAASAKSFTPLAAEEAGELQVLGLSSGGAPSTHGGEAADTAAAEALAGTTAKSLVTTGDAATDGVAADRQTSGEGTAGDGEEEDANELPPWALFEEEDEFNLSTGRFGDPNTGRLQELSDSKVRLLPSQAAQAKWSVDRQLLPTSLKDVVQEAELAQERRHAAIEQEYERRLQYTKYRKWDHLIAKAQTRRSQARAKEAEAGAPQPLPPKRRLAQLLRKGRDRKRISEDVQAKYTREL